MNWSSRIFYVLVLPVIQGSIVTLLWMGFCAIQGKRKNSRYIYVFLRGVVCGYLFPLVYLIGYQLFCFYYNVYDDLAITTEKMQQLYEALVLVWVVGLLVNILLRLRSLYAFQQICHVSYPAAAKEQEILQRLKKELAVRKKISLRRGYRVKTPFLCGIFSVSIYLPVQEFKEEELEIILYHELVHYKQRDNLWKPVFTLIHYIYWFNPLTKYLWSQLQRWTEASCDAACCDVRFSACRYFQLLLDMSEDGTGKNTLDFAPMWSESGVSLKWRVQCMKRNRRNRNTIVVAILVVTSMLIGGVSTKASVTGMKSLCHETIENTKDVTVESVNADDGELQEIVTTEEMFEGTTIIDEEETATPFSLVKTVDWTVGNKVTKRSNRFYVNQGADVGITVSVTPKDRVVSVGIMSDNGVGRCVNSSGTISHTFSSIARSGYYYFFVTNESGKSVNVEGAYVVD